MAAAATPEYESSAVMVGEMAPSPHPTPPGGGRVGAPAAQFHGKAVASQSGVPGSRSGLGATAVPTQLKARLDALTAGLTDPGGPTQLARLREKTR